MASDGEMGLQRRDRMRDRRRRPRISLRRSRKRIPAEFHTSRLDGRGLVSRLSWGGMFVKSDQVPKPSEPIRLVLHHGTGKLEVQGIVRWTYDQAVEKGFFVEAYGPSEAYREFFERILKT